MSRLLFSEGDTLVINPQLAKLIGLNEAIILQQIHYWIDNKYCAGHVHLGRKWIYNTVSQWHEQFPFISTSTIKRVMCDLREKGLIEVQKLSKDGLNHTNYYTINYPSLDALRDQIEQIDGVNLNQPKGSDWSKPNRTETTTEINSNQDEKQRKTPDCPHQKLLDLFGDKVPELPKPRVWTDKRMKDMAARWKWVMSQKDESGQPKHQTADDGIQFFGRFFDYVATSDFLTGRSGAWTKCDLPWLMKEENFAKVIEGQYENKGGM